jgi:signal transduction histidine kinase
MLSGAHVLIRHGPAASTTEDSVETLFALLSDGGGEMGERICRYDWTKTPLGPITTWSQAFRTALRLCMASRLPAGIYWGPEHIFLYNDAHRANLGHKHPHALGRPAAVVWPEVFGTIEPLMQKCLLRGETCGADELPLLLSRAGFRQEVYFSFSYEPLINESGVIEAVYAVIVDTSKRVIAERRLRTLRALASSERHSKSPPDALTSAARVIAQNAYDVPFASLYLWSENRRDASLCALSNIEAGGPASPATVHRGANGAFAELAGLSSGKLLETRDIVSGLTLNSAAGWKAPPVKMVVLPFGSAAVGAPAGFGIFGINPHAPMDSEYLGFLHMLAGQIAESIEAAYVSQREGARVKALAALDHAQTTFFGNVSHELRTPLTLMLGPLEETLDGNGGPLTDEQRAALAMVRRNGLQLQKLVNEVLDFARTQSDRLHAMFEPVNLSALTAQLASSFEWFARKANIVFRVECEELGEPVYVDRDIWSKIVLNLLSNAFKYTVQGEIRVVLRKRDAAELIVSDSGMGIPQRELARIFERFHRVAGTGGRSSEGAGIGLALVKELVEQHGGSVTVRSKLGEGSTFTVSIPLGLSHLSASNIRAVGDIQSTPAAHAHGGCQAHTEQAAFCGEFAALEAIQHKPSSSPGPAGGKRVLLVDDNADMREYTGMVLGKHFEVEAVADGRAALAAARTSPPDLVIADVMMPNLDGLALLRELRGNEGTRAVPVILLSARGGEESRIQGLEGGADDYLVKPFSARELVARANSAIKLARLRAQAAQQDERLRIARDLHDTLLQSVQGMSFLLEAGLQQLASDEDSAHRLFHNAMQAATQAVAEGREVLSLLRSSAPERYDLTEGLLRLGRELLGGTPMRFSVNVEGQQRELRPRAWTEAYAICREALSNAARHADAHSSVLKLSYLSDFEVVISDDGKGMSARMISRGREGHFGLTGMRERAASLGARLAFESGRGAGTTIMLTIPGNVAYAEQAAG